MAESAETTIVLRINQLRQALSHVLPVAKEAYKGYGMGCFSWIEGKLWLISGSFQSRVAGGVVHMGERVEGIENIFFDLYSLNLLLKTPFVLDSIKVTVDSAVDTRKIRFQVGRSYKELPVTNRDDGYAEYLDLPAYGSGIDASDFLEWGGVANFAHPNDSHSLHSVHIVVQAGWGHILATSGFSSGYVWFEVNDKLLDFRYTIPSEFFLLGNSIQWDGIPYLSASGSRCVLRSEEKFIFGATVNYEYPAEQVINGSSNYGNYPAAQVPVTELIAALNVFADVHRAKDVLSVEVWEEDESSGMIFSAGEEGVNGQMHVPISSGTFGRDKLRINGAAVKAAANLLKTTRTMFVFIQQHNDGFLVIRPENGAVFVLGTMSH